MSGQTVVASSASSRCLIDRWTSRAPRTQSWQRAERRPFSCLGGPRFLHQACKAQIFKETVRSGFVLYESAVLAVQKGDPSPVWTDRESCTAPARLKSAQTNCRLYRGPSANRTPRALTATPRDPWRRPAPTPKERRKTTRVSRIRPSTDRAQSPSSRTTRCSRKGRGWCRTATTGSRRRTWNKTRAWWPTRQPGGTPAASGRMPPHFPTARLSAAGWAQRSPLVAAMWEPPWKPCPS